MTAVDKLGKKISHGDYIIIPHKGHLIKGLVYHIWFTKSVCYYKLDYNNRPTTRDEIHISHIIKIPSPEIL